MRSVRRDLRRCVLRRLWSASRCAMAARCLPPFPDQQVGPAAFPDGGRRRLLVLCAALLIALASAMLRASDAEPMARAAGAVDRAAAAVYGFVRCCSPALLIFYVLCGRAARLLPAAAILILLALFAVARRAADGWRAARALAPLVVTGLLQAAARAAARGACCRCRGSACMQTRSSKPSARLSPGRADRRSCCRRSTGSSSARCPACRPRWRRRCSCRSPSIMSPIAAIATIVTASAMAIFSGDIPGALLRIPGTPASAAYTDEAYAMTRKGQAGAGARRRPLVLARSAASPARCR